MATKSVYLEKRGILTKEISDLTGKVAQENRSWSEDENAKFDQLRKDMIEVEAALEKLDFVEKLSNPSPGVEVKASAEQQKEIEVRAWHDYLIRGERMSATNYSILEKRGTLTQITTTDGLGGFLIPETWSARIIEILKAFGGIYEDSQVDRSNTGAVINYPVEDVTAQVGAIIAETIADVVQDVTWANKAMGAFMYTSNIIKASWEFLQDNVYNAEQRIINIAYQRIARILAQHFVSGDGSTQPEGILVGGTAIATASATVFTYAELVTLVTSLDPAYMNMNTKLYLNNTTLGTIMKLVDTTGQPLWNLSYREGMPSTILGLPYRVVQDMPSSGTTAYKFMAIADLKSAYTIREVMGDKLTVFRELYAAQRVNGYVVNSRWDAKVLNPAAIKYLQHA